MPAKEVRAEICIHTYTSCAYMCKAGMGLMFHSSYQFSCRFAVLAGKGSSIHANRIHMQIKQMQTHASTQNVQNLYIKVPIHAVADDYTTVASPVILCTSMLRLRVQED